MPIQLTVVLQMLEIIFNDNYLVAINKPPGLAVHRSPLIGNTDEFALQLLRDQIGQKVFPCHRLDRKTSGVLIFALNKDLLPKMMTLFAEGKLCKKYLAIVRGYTSDEGVIDYALKDGSGKSKEAVTIYRTLERIELNVPFGKHQTSRYSLVEATPQTGRMHQLRKHFAHILHPLIGDRPHGCNKQNKLFLEKWDMKEMLLHARSLEFVHPKTHETLQLKAEFHGEFQRITEMMGFIL